MDDGMQWLAGTILSAVISSVITVAPKGKSRKSNRATVANVRIRMFTHIGRINNTTIVREVLKRA